MAGNLAVVRAAAGPGARIYAVVKANAYGHGAVEISRVLESLGIDGLCVATWDEALELRAARVRAPILVLFAVPPSFAREAADRRISISIGDLGQLAATLAAFATAGPRRPSLHVHLEVETGLGRNGLRLDHVAAAARQIARARLVRLDGLWTHTQNAADPEILGRQVERFEEAVTTLRADALLPPIRHAAASAAMLVDGVLGYDAVRAGLLLYGLVPDDLARRAVPEAGQLRPAMSLHARPIRVLELPAGWGISYGPSFVTTRPSRIATLPLGYGDGWPRTTSNRAAALVRGRRVPLVGTVAMDAVMADVTDVPGPPVTVDDEFVLLGRQGDESITAADLAASRGTISYEVVTAMAGRLPRVYHAPSGAHGLRTLASGPALATLPAPATDPAPRRRTQRS